MTEFTFDVLKHSWKLFRANRKEELETLAPSLVKPEEIFLKKIAEDDMSMTIQFMGLINAVDNTQFIPQIKRLLTNWLKKVSMDVRIMRSDSDTLIVKISKELKIGESLENIPIPKRVNHKYEQSVRIPRTTIIRETIRGEEE